MANRLKVAKVVSISALRERGWSQRRIARELGIDRATVALHLASEAKAAKAAAGSDNSNTAKAPTGSERQADAPNAAKAPTGSGAEE